MFLNAEMAITSMKHLEKSTKISYIIRNQRSLPENTDTQYSSRAECSYKKCTALPMQGKANSSVIFHGRLDRTSFYNRPLKERDLRQISHLREIKNMHKKTLNCLLTNQPYSPNGRSCKIPFMNLFL